MEGEILRNINKLGIAPGVHGKIGMCGWLSPSAHTISINCFREQPMARKYYDKSNLSAVPISNNHKFINLTNQVFGRLTVIAYAGALRKATHWFCECECGNVVKIGARNLVRGITKSCGCMRQEMMTTHGKARTCEYKIWQSMKARCKNPNAKAYPYYGGRGIKVCKRWLAGFDSFYEDMGERPSEKHSLERVENNGDYSPENCKWVLRIEQSNNQRNNILATVGGQTKTIAQWSGGTQTKMYGRARARVSRGWCDECAITNGPGVSCDHKEVV